MDRKTSKQRTLHLVQLAILLALVIVLQVFGSYLRIGPVNFTLVLIPVVLGGIMLGRKAGTFLGLVFGLVVLVMGLTGADGGFVLWLMADHPVLTVLLCVVKGVAAGMVPACLYHLLKNKLKFGAVVIASAAAPLVNTGLFFLGSLLMLDTYGGNAAGQSAMYFLIFGCIGVNFIVELLLNIVVSPAVDRVVTVFKKRMR
ncbi:MAG: ECF transporter S component [Clostridia bacterium]|nr:ECF transporter S component [Clostridia bacterium]